MIARLTVNEFAKMRRLHTAPVATALVLVVVLLALYTVVSSPAAAPDSAQAWLALLAGMSLAMPLVWPLLIAVLASRQTDVEHHGQGWLLHGVAGVTPGRVCGAKLAALGTVVLVATVGASALVLIAGRVLLGIVPGPPLGHWIAVTACMTVVNLAVLALSVLVAAWTANQLVVLGLGVLGCVVALFSQGLPAWAAHLTPWGYYALAAGADARGDGFVATAPSVASTVVLAAIATAVFAAATRRLDRQEV